LATPSFIPDAPSPPIIRFFAVWIARMLRKDFHAVLAGRGTAEMLASFNSDTRPLIVLMNHSSWWDPLIGLYLARTLLPARPVLGPMEAEQLAKFSFFRKLGIFGIDPDHPEAMNTLVNHAATTFAKRPATAFWLTPQGEFTDVRTPVRLRPGAAAVAARLDAQHPLGCRCVVIASELVFWTDRRPELLLNLRAIDDDAGRRASTLGWTRAMTQTMQAAADDLATHARARDSSAFDVLLGSGDGRINWLYNLWLKCTGRSATLTAKKRTVAALPGPSCLLVAGMSAGAAHDGSKP